MITSEQCRLARGWLGWDQKKLADVAGVARNTISLFENGKGEPRKATLLAVQHAFEQSGVRFNEDSIILGQQQVQTVGTSIRFGEEGGHYAIS